MATTHYLSCCRFQMNDKIERQRHPVNVLLWGNRCSPPAAIACGHKSNNPRHLSHIWNVQLRETLWILACQYCLCLLNFMHPHPCTDFPVSFHSLYPDHPWSSLCQTQILSTRRRISSGCTLRFLTAAEFSSCESKLYVEIFTAWIWNRPRQIISRVRLLHPLLLSDLQRRSYRPFFFETQWWYQHDTQT